MSATQGSCVICDGPDDDPQNPPVPYGDGWAHRYCAWAEDEYREYDEGRDDEES